MSTLTVPMPVRCPRPNSSPQSGVSVAPAQDTSRTPWAALLDQSFAGECTWVMDADGVLLPVPLDEVDALPRRRVTRRRRRG